LVLLMITDGRETVELPTEPLPELGVAGLLPLPVGGISVGGKEMTRV
jgi:hypothetical protein